jgi:hypothetical protein
MYAHASPISAACLDDSLPPASVCEGLPPNLATLYTERHDRSSMGICNQHRGGDADVPEVSSNNWSVSDSVRLRRFERESARFDAFITWFS